MVVGAGLYRWSLVKLPDMNRIRVLIASALLLCGGAQADGFGTAVFASGAGRVALVELYTSEGCSSCPPADRWLSSRKHADGLWTRFVPVAFHVDYWNYIGWPDRFADPAFSARQRALVNGGAAQAVYTPGFFIDGEEWLGWRRGGAPRPAEDVPGELRVRVDGRDVVVEFVPAGAVGEPLSVYVALLGMGLVTEVSAGENEGRNLEHDFVVLSLGKAGMRASGTAYRSTLTLPQVDSDAESFAVAAFVTGPDGLQPVQATGGPIG